MTAIEIARKLAAMEQVDDAVDAYALSLQNASDPLEELEAASYILDHGGDYRISYTAFVNLYNYGLYRDMILPLLEETFYTPNIRLLRGRYERNCRRLEKYPYLFRKDFPAFEDLPIRFFPFDDHHGYLPFYRAQSRFGEFANVRNAVVSRNFFKNLDMPILASDVFSQYEWEYLNDNVRRSEDIGRENHIYLHYTDWETFCAWLQVLNVKPLTESEKVVFLMEEQLEQYPIDFKARFGIDYSIQPVKPVRVQEINKIIWHTQLSTHNGGDFFNEVFDAHPNLLAMPSLMLDNIKQSIREVRTGLEQAGTLKQAQESFQAWNNPRLVQELYHMREPTDKDLLVALYMTSTEWTKNVDWSSRIVPAIFFQPHFHNIVYSLKVDRRRRTVLHSKSIDEIHSCKFLQQFKYIKTFTPMRRFTNSHGATVRFMYNSAVEAEQNGQDTATHKTVVPDAVSERVVNRSFMIDPDDRLYHDSVLVRLEDGKLNPKATFTALAAFLDLPYTKSMEVCTEKGEPVPYWGSDKYAPGFDPASIYPTYDDYTNDSERIYIEFFLRAAYKFYGYDFNYYDGGPMDIDRIRELVDGFSTIDSYIRKTWCKVSGTLSVHLPSGEVSEDLTRQIQDAYLEKKLQGYHDQRVKNAEILMRDLQFVNRSGQPLYMMPMLQLDPGLLENPVYH